MKIYQHIGAGHYIGSCIMVICKNRKTAEDLISEELAKHGLCDEPLRIEEIPISENKIIYSDNGDY